MKQLQEAIVVQLCSRINYLEIVAEFSNAIDGIKFLNKQTVDVIFLDIHMPGFSGFDFVQTLKNPPKIVLITSDTKFAIDAYEYLSIVDYLVKPITEERFRKSIEKVKDSLQKQATVEKEVQTDETQEELYINIDRRLIKLRLNEILFDKSRRRLYRS